MHNKVIMAPIAIAPRELTLYFCQEEIQHSSSLKKKAITIGMSALTVADNRSMAERGASESKWRNSHDEIVSS